MQNRRLNPAFVYSEAVQQALRQGHLRAHTPTAEELEKWNLDTSMAFYENRFADASDFAFVFTGSFDLETIEPLVERYLGSLPATGRRETWKDVGIRYPTGVVEKRIEKGVEPKSQASLVFTGAFEWSPQQRTVMRALGDVLEARLREKLREDLGGTYGVGVSPGYANIPVNEYALNISFSCAPERTEELIKATLAEIALVETTGPTAQQVADVREKLLRDFETNSKSNIYWAQQLMLKYRAGEDPSSLFEQAELYRALTTEVIQAAAKRYLNPANMVKVTLFPEKKPKP